ncbi:MAG: N-acetylmuramoyl-L-alanine amidase [Acidobacteriia bacterium]|nr:N-acetylmuramoyl-L-alanine amidase [Terriglobia bacterium]
MSAHPTRVDWEAAPLVADPGAALREGNRVLESIARQEALRSLLAFSELRAKIRNRQSNAQSGLPADLLQSERFVLDEVLQLICDRALAITGADGVMIALAERSGFLCRAAAGAFLVERGAHLTPASDFLTEGLDSGLFVRCDDAETDARVEFDLTKQLGALASVLVPLRGRHARLGVIQAFSKTPFGFSDGDLRTLDLFAELVLSALKPEDQDRRINWLSDVAGEVLYPKPAPQIPVATAPPAVAPPLERPAATEPAKTKIEERAIPEPPSAIQETVPQPIIAVPDFHFSAEEAEPQIEEETETEATPRRALRLLPAVTGPSSRPGLNVVIGLIAVAALFSAGVWWGMQVPGAGVTKVASALKPPPAPMVPGSPTTQILSDNLMDPAKFAPDAAPPSPEKLAALPKITGLRHWSSSMGSTVVIDMEDQVPYEVHRLMSPERIYFDLHDAVLVPELDGKSIDVGESSLTRVRVAQPVAGVTRIVLDTKDGSNFSVSMESNPYRLVVELRGSDRAVASNHATPAVPAGRFAAAAALSPLPLKPAEEHLAAKAGKFRIVLDAGHGGWDLGTVGRQGLLEKDLVLDVTQRLGKLLEARLGSEVVFTRTDDSYLALDQRADLANQSQADLFVSVHANYSNSATARGVETYYTNFFSAPGSKELEKRENGGILTPVTASLSAGGLQAKIEQSRRLAASIQRSLYATLATRNPGIRDRGIKDAAFAVLTGTTMPAILTEISFVSSPADEQKLRNETYRQEIAEALYKGIAHYEQSAQHPKVAQLQQTSAHR